MKIIPLSQEDMMHNAPSETARYRHLTAKYCYVAEDVPGCGVDIASQGQPVVPWAISYDLPEAKYNEYNGGNPPKGVLHLRGDAASLPFCNESLDFVYSSHLLEDYLDWTPILKEWLRVLRPNGYMIILIPDKEMWAKAMRRGQSPNMSHRHEGYAGEMSIYAKQLRMEVIEDRMTNQFPDDYSILGVFRKIHGGW